MYTHPSPYAEHRTTSSTGADIGTAAPCSTGFARTGVLRLGNKFGRREWRAEPIVCVWVCVVVPATLPAPGRPAREDSSRDCPAARLDWVIVGGTGDCTTLRAGLSEPDLGGVGGTDG
ncbi:hypothetical protein AOCH_004770 [Aspergillus ochraceoroseus]|uniref:Uncharacterized protein n=1 Tax=Aspergillus ochraceoroseus TaxID=138278 RepID=A0A0F8USX0_9EURO|nr:hypothetical protein AOCH_004770 [Aspergillus ochraceoroseus]